MTVITDYVDAVEAAFDDIKGDLTTISGQASALQAQVADLTAQLAAAGTLSDSDKAALDKLKSDAGDLASTADTAAGKVTVPPPAPDAPPTTS